MKQGNITENELDASKNYYINNLKAIKDSVFQFEDYYVGGILSGSALTLDEITNEINKVTLFDITKIAKNIQIDTVYFLANSQLA